MKIVIDIPDFIYERLKEDVNCGMVNLNSAIANGTPLPKGHGDLIDRSKLHTNYVGTELDTDLAVYLEPTIDNAPTVIPADR